MKKCSKCKTNKNYKDFHSDLSTKDGYTYQCKACRNKSSRNYLKTERGRYVHRTQEKIRRSVNPKSMLLNLAKQRAKRKGLDFCLRCSDFDIPDMCPVLGIPIFSSEKLTDNSPTIDRINNTVGYVANNIMVISWRANRLKSDASASELEKILTYMYENLPEYRTATGVRRQTRPTKFYTLNGKSQGLIDWAEEYDIAYSTLNSRVNRSGWSLEKALLTPVRKVVKK